MKGYVDNIEKLSIENEKFRKVLYTAKHCQLVLMSLLPNEEIGEEVHEENDQFLRVDLGTGKAVLDGVEHDITDGFAILVPAGTRHNIINTSATAPMKLYTLYAPPHHLDKIEHDTKAVAQVDVEEFNGKTTE
jgi:mannose-6-phosphate isomerase-like protein (cupin superfamily)